VVQPVDLNQTVSLRGQVPPAAQPQNDQGPVDPSFSIPYAFLLLKRTPAQQADLDQLLAEQQDRSSANYHRWLTPEQYAERFGLSGSDIAKITNWLASQGLQVHEIARGRHWVTFSGAGGDVSRAFHTEFHRYRVNGADQFSNATEPSIPAAFDGVIAGVHGFNDFRWKSHLLKPVHPEMTAGSTHSLVPDDFARIYDLQPLYKAGIDGTGQTIGILGESSVDLTDIQAFRQQYNLPPKVPQSLLFGPDPGMTGALGEADLDLEWAGAIAPKATIVYVYAQDVYFAGAQAVDQNVAPVFSISFGQCEQEVVTDFETIAQQANAQGITLLVSSGDSGAAGCDLAFSGSQAAKGKAVSFPASLPEVTAVGGTEFNEGNGTYWSKTNDANGGSALSYIPEKAWNDTPADNMIAATGGGASVLYQKPEWQAGPGVPNDSARDVPDVSLSASGDHDGYMIYSQGSLYPSGGTSAAAPSFAGILGLLNHYLSTKGGQPGLGNINPELYHLAQRAPQAFHDITSGNNRVPCVQSTPNCSGGSLGYSAGAGYDPVTGLGSVDAYNLVTKWSAGATSSTSLTANPSNIGFEGGQAQLTATVTASSATPAGSVNFLALGRSLGNAALTSSTSGTASATISIDAGQLPIGTDTVAADYPGDSDLDGSGGSTTVTVAAPSTGSAVMASVDPPIVPRLPPDASGYEWFVGITLQEEAGVATTLTGFSIDGFSEDSRLQVFFPNTAIPANGSIFGSVASRGLITPVTRTFSFSGQDANGRKWSTQTTAQYVSRELLVPQMKLTSAPSTLKQDPNGTPACQWKQELVVEEQSGFWVSLYSLTAGGNDISGQIQNIFGTTSLAPYGSLHGELCLDSGNAVGTSQYELDGFTEEGQMVTATMGAILLGATPGPATISATPSSITMSVANSSGTATSALTLNATGGNPSWSVSVFPTLTTSWLFVNPRLGTAPLQINLKASAAGLSNGVYTAQVVIQSSAALPQHITVPVTLVVGASSKISIQGVSNAASAKLAFAPGMVMAVYGSGLAPAKTAQSAGILPLPINIAGVSVTVNGVTAPFYYAAPGQLNVQIPYETGAGPAVVGVNNNGQVAAFAFPVAMTGPGIFTDQSGMLVPKNSGPRGKTLVLFMTGEGDVYPPQATGTAPPYGIPLFFLPAPTLPVVVTVGGVETDTPAFIGIPYG